MYAIEQYFLDAYKRLDRMKALVKERFTEIWGTPPDPEELAETCWHVWRLSNFYVEALRATQRQSRPERHAPYTPTEVTGERTERLRDIDERLQEVLGDSVELGDAVTDDEDGDDEDDEFQPDLEEQIMMVEYGSIIHEHARFIHELGSYVLEDGIEVPIQNLVARDVWGVDTLLLGLLRALTDQISVHQRCSEATDRLDQNA